ncbi:DNA mismatch repair protein [Alkalicella caledoniensis]|uniref:DNA mismatch repair protein n=1 Tax=Alkalicella caledoniensis TaxID=2731377 RepID=A0A7G9W8T5_ALKCA|nr:DNA mismatch repair protein [Alkalicella caledoniensis]QNO15097.1 DNA mismatch repair protein [Alkalicella caledoniensis]
MERLKLYENKLSKYKKDAKKARSKMDIISNLRLAVVLIGLIAMLYNYFYVSERASWITLIVGAIIFFILIKYYNKIKYQVLSLESLIKINKSNIQRLKGHWTEFEDSGDDFIDKDHKFSFDLDVFGRGSLFQWMNVANTPRGRSKLNHLLTSENNKEIILSRQEAVKELANDLDWRQELHSLGLLLKEKTDDTDIKNLFCVKTSLYLKPLVTIISRLLPLITIGLLILAYGFEIVPPAWGIGLYVLQFFLILIGAKQRGKALNSLFAINTNITTYNAMLKVLENKSFKSKLLNSLKEKLKGPKGEKGYILIEEFNSITERSGNRNNFFFFPINVLLLWDYTTMVKLEKWKLRAGRLLENMIDVIGEVESLSSLGQILYDNPKWVMPKFNEEKSIISATKIGHPLIGQERVLNDIALDDNRAMLLITGSNMSGKSTLLRTVGINMVLAYAGAPVCAQFMELSMFDLHTSMRISDNLEKSISSFYGELLRIKGILESNKRNKKQTFVLLDEIFKGTNSYDRHIGAKGLIVQLLDRGCMGLVSTHDLELEVMEKETKGLLKNYHFQEYYVDDEIKFDYKLKQGVSKTRNALYLLKLIGIDV